LASLTAGLYRRHILDIWLRGEQAGAITKELVIARKNQVMLGEYREVLETIEPRFSFKDVGGNVALKERPRIPARIGEFARQLAFASRRQAR
jgi:hypothetical protein